MTKNLLLSLIATLLLLPAAARGELRIGSVCRVKGQDENTLQGMGIVVGLKGTGDSELSPTLRALARTMHFMGNSVAKGQKGEEVFAELKNAKNVALVFVTATIPAEGAQQGSQINCVVNAVSAKSLDGGYLLLTPLLGPRPGNARVYAFAQGPLTLEDPAKPVSAKIHGGCRLEETFENQFTADGKFTLVIDKNHASFAMAHEVENAINGMDSFRRDGRSPGERAAAPRVPAVPASQNGRNTGRIAKAIDQVHVEVKIPPYEVDDSVPFVRYVLDQIIIRQNEPRVVINERTGAIVIGADVELGPVAVKHKNFVIETGGAAATSPWVAVDSSTVTGNTTKLKALVDALNALKVSSGDVIDIIKGLERSGDLYGKVITE